MRKSALGWNNDTFASRRASSTVVIRRERGPPRAARIVIGPPAIAAAASFSNTVSGAAYGAGIEARLWAGWTGKVEYLHLGGTTNTFLLPGTLTGGAGGGRSPRPPAAFATTSSASA